MARSGRQRRQAAIVTAGGIMAALAVLWIPVGLIETIVASSGLSEALPAAAPPLGMKARLLVAIFAAVMTVGLIGVLRRNRPEGTGTQGNRERTSGVQGAKTMGFAFSKLSALARGRVAAVTGRDTPHVRRADAHPDAPARAPIFASRDFGGLDIFPEPTVRRRTIGPQIKPEWSEPVQDSMAPLADLAMPSAPAPMAEAELPQPAFLRPAAPWVEDDIVADDYASDTHFDAVPVVPDVRDIAPTHGLSITQLTQRLERGLAQRGRDPGAGEGAMRVIADMPVTPAVRVRDAVAQDTDEALRAALGALRTMAGRGR